MRVRREPDRAGAALRGVATVFIGWLIYEWMLVLIDLLREARGFEPLQ